MSWLPVLALALLAFLAIALVLKAARSGWEAIGAALLLGIAGYALQGSPGLPGAPKTPVEQMKGDGSLQVAARQQLGKGQGGAQSNWQIIGDAMARNGQYGDAASVLLGAVEQDPNNADAWLALGNALTGHAEGNLSPAALYAYRRAEQAAPDHPGPPFFLGLALAQSGQLVEARKLWADLLARSPKDSPWRADLEQRLAELDAFIAAQTGAPVR
ncbi:MAG TPA: tetratricopeptide repeat protein [Novosphingobium sp.]|nr:tetratricopeptide repeat protein [Novosphingobium sp.]